MRQASQASKTRVLRFKEPLSVCTDQFCRIGRAEPHNPAGISAHATHKQHRPRFYTAWVIRDRTISRQSRTMSAIIGGLNRSTQHRGPAGNK
jgi:hypothetical protein